MGHIVLAAAARAASMDKFVAHPSRRQRRARPSYDALSGSSPRALGIDRSTSLRRRAPALSLRPRCQRMLDRRRSTPDVHIDDQLGAELG